MVKILMEHIEYTFSLESRLQIGPTYAVVIFNTLDSILEYIHPLTFSTFSHESRPN